MPVLLRQSYAPSSTVSVVFHEPREPLLTIQLRFLASKLSQNSLTFLENFLHYPSENYFPEILQNKTEEIYYDLVIKIKIDPHETSQFNRKKKFHGIKFEFHIFEKGPLTETSSSQKTNYSITEPVKLIFPLSSHYKINKLFQQFYKEIKQQDKWKISPLLFMQTIIQILQNKNLHDINYFHKDNLEANKKFLQNINYLLEDFLKYQIFPGIQKIEKMQEQDTLFMSIQDIQQYNTLITTQAFRELINYFQKILKQQAVNLQGAVYHSGFFSFIFQLPLKKIDKDADRLKWFSCLQKFCGNFYTDLTDRDNIHIECTLKDFGNNQILLDLSLIGGRAQIENIAFLFKFSSDLNQILEQTIQETNSRPISSFSHFIEGDLNFVLHFLNNLKKGNFFEITGSYQPNDKQIASLHTYNQIHHFKNVCYTLQEFIEMLLNFDSVQNNDFKERKIDTDNKKENDLIVKKLQETVQTVGDELFENLVK